MEKDLVNKADSIKYNLLKMNDSSPDLTPDEISKIQSNLLVMKRFNKDMYTERANIITEVWGILQQQSENDKSPPDNDKNKWLEDVLMTVGVLVDVAGILTADPLIAIIGVGIGATADLITTNSSAAAVTGDDLSGAMGYLSSRNTNFYNAMQKMVDYYYENTNDCRDYVFSWPEGTIKLKDSQSYTLRDLIPYTFSEGTAYDNVIIGASRMFRNIITMREMVKLQYWDLYFVQDVAVKGSEFGKPFQPCAAPSEWGIQRELYYNKEHVGNNKVIFTNDGIRHFNPDYVSVVSSGNNDTDLTSSYKHAHNDFISKFPSAFIYPWLITVSTVFYQRLYLVEGQDKIRDPKWYRKDEKGIRLTNGDFLNWLFIDDGAGNILNPNGVVFRYDAFRSKNLTYIKSDQNLFLHSDQITDEIILDAPVYIEDSSTNYRYGPTNSSSLNQKYHVYVGDLVKNSK
jgi:hypothetical protein